MYYIGAYDQLLIFFLYSLLFELFRIAYAAGCKAYYGCIAVILCKFRYVYACFIHNTYKKYKTVAGVIYKMEKKTTTDRMYNALSVMYLRGEGGDQGEQSLI